ncbi:MAG: hypothetical protein HZB99_03505 [Candidatus Harrisonbacteria bacterium]|nr:hypothetical protein [Candidatus Harrisonbacteria bacterium]
MLKVVGIIDLVISLGLLGLGLFVIVRNRQRRINQLFGAVVLSLVGWIVSSSLSDLSPNEWWALFWARGAIIGPFFFCASFLYFTYFFPRDGRSLSKLKTAIIFGIPVLALILVPTKYNIEKVTLYEWGTDFVPGILYSVLLVCLISYFGKALHNLFKKYQQADSYEKAQIFYVFLGIVLVLLIGTFTNLILPVYFETGRLSVVGPSLAILIFTSLTAYAIVVHHLLDIWIVIRLGTIFTLLFAIISFIYVGIIGLLGQYIGSFSALVIASLFITLTFEPLKRFIEDKTDKIFFRKHYQMDEVIDELTSVVHKIELNLNKILDAFNDIAAKYFKVAEADMFVLTPAGTFVEQRVMDHKRELELGPDNPIVVFFNSNPGFVFNLEVIGRKMQDGELNLPVERIDLVPKVFEEMEKLDFTVALPISARNQLIGIYFLGKKKSGDDFSHQDLQLLNHLVLEIGAFIDNARLYEDLKRLDEAKSNFISVVSHQLRTPLSAMRWDTELLLDGKIDKKTQEEFLQDTYKNSLFMISHLDDMLIALDIGDKEINLVKERCGLKNFIDEVMLENQLLIQQKQLKFNVDLIELADNLFIDCKKIKKIIWVLLTNAINYSPANYGVVTINSRERQIDERKFIEVAVQDNGIGIIGEEQRYIFQKFFRGEEAKKMSPNGFGLGLYIVKAFVEAHGGMVTFNSAGRYKGATFTFTLPL